MASPRNDSFTKPSHGLLCALFAATLVLAIPHATFGQCQSFDSETTALGLTPTLISTVSQNFTVCHDPAFRDDLALFEEWVATGMELGLRKYGFVGPVTRDGEPADVLIFLPPTPTARTSRGHIGVTSGRRSDLGNGNWRAELHYLTPSAWGPPPYGGLSYPSAEEYHAHYIVHETMHIVQFGLEDIHDHDADRWIWEGLAEYDGYLHTTHWNRTEAVYRLFDRSEERDIPSSIYCCRTLGGRSAAMATSDVYYGGAIVMTFLAEHFGEAIHAELFTAPMADLMAARDTTVDDAFTQFQTWYPAKLEEIANNRSAPGADYTPSMACTGRYWYAAGKGGVPSFEVRILNNDQRSRSHEVFKQQYRPDASHSWTTRSSVAIVRRDRSGYSTPLFTGVSSPPFQWRARSCPPHQHSNRLCSHWSNIINWTTSACASTRIGTGPAFTDDPLMANATPVRAIHFRELRQSIGDLRARASLPPMQWTDPTLTPGKTPVKRVHLAELRSALDAVHDAVGRARPSYTDEEVATRGATIRAVHLMELRDAVAGLEAALARSLPYPTKPDPDDASAPSAASTDEDVDTWTTEWLDPPEQLHDQVDLREAQVSHQ